MNEDAQDQQVGQVSLVKKVLGAKVHKLLAFFFIASGTALTLSLSAQIGPEFAISDAVYSSQTSIIKSVHSHGSVQGAAITNGLVAYWAFNEGTGTTTADGSGNGKTGTLVNTPSWIDGKLGKGLLFASGKRVNVPDTYLGNTPFTYASWVKTSATDGWVIGQGEGSDLRIASGKVLSQLYTTSNFQNTYGNTSINDGQWHHVAVTRTGSTVNIYIDGVLDKTAAIIGTPENVGFLALASRDDTGTSGFAGSLDEVYIFNRALSGTEVSTLYTTGTTPPPDTTPPTVSISAPVAGATVSGTSTSITANASDNIGVVGVQFKLDGVNLGVEDTTSPYSYTWNTTTTTNGTHSLTATTRDAAGNSTTSTSISITVNNQILTAPVITTFTSSPSSISSGQTSTLTWDVTGSSPIVLSINQSVGTVTGTSKTVSPTTTTTYTLTASNSVGSTTANTTVTVAAVPPTGGLEGYWAFNEGTGTTTADSSGKNRTGTLVGSPSWVNGKSGKALLFGAGKSVNVSDTVVSSTAYTVAAWVNTTSGEGWLVGNGEGSDLRLSGGKVLFQLYTSSNFQNTYSNASVNNGQWRHVAATYSGGTVSIYIDGVLDKSVTVSGTPNGLGFQSIANRTDSNSGDFGGTLDELRVYSKALTASEISTLVGVITPPSDTTPPTISITSPVAGATLSGTPQITVNAADNVGVAGVQFKVDGLNIGNEVTTTPFVANFNTTTVSNGTHTLTATARDAVGNITTSAGVNITVSNQAAQVAAPTISPVGGTYTSIQSASLSTSTSGATIRYTTNGTDPTSSSTQYTAPLTIASSGTVKARAFKSGMTDSAVLTANYTVNLPPANTPPTGNLEGINVTNKTIGGWAHDPDNLNVPVLVHLYFDGQTNGTPLVVTANENRIDVGNHAFNAPIPAQYLNGQPHTVYAWAIDLSDTTGASNRLLPGSPKSFNIAAADTTPPTVSITAPLAGSTVSGTSTAITATASDNVGVVGVQFKLDGANLGAEDTTSPYSYTWNTTTATNGTHTLTATTRDAAGLTSTSTISITVNNQALQTVVTPTISPAGGTFTTSQSVTLATTTSGASIRYTTDGSNPTSTIGTVYSSAITVSTSSTVKAIAYKSGMLDSGVATASFTINTVPQGSCTGSNCVNVNASQLFQMIDGWEGTDFAGYRYVSTTTWNAVKNQIFDGLVNDLGMNRIRLEAVSGLENNTDYYTQWLNGQISEDTWVAKSYQVVNDNSDANSINPSGFVWTSFDDKIDNIVLPIRQRLQARGEQLFINVNYVDFKRAATGTTYQHKSNPTEYAEFVLAVYQHMQSRYGFVPDAWEVILEPDTTTAAWSASQTAAAIKAAGDKLVANGFTPRFIAPSVTNASNAASYISSIANTSGAMAYVDTFSYHLYGARDSATISQIANLGTQYGKKTAMLEFIGADYNNLQTDLTSGKNSAWQQFTLASLSAWGTNTGDAYYTIFENNNTLQMQNQAKFFSQYFKYIRKGAQRIGATNTGNPFISPLAFRNADGKYVVVSTVAGSSSPVSFGVNGLPAGTYGVYYTTGDSGNASTIQMANQTITAGGAVNVTLPTGTVGVVTIYGVGTGTPPPVDTTAPTVSISAPIAGATVSGTSTSLTATAADNVGVVGVQFKLDGVNLGAEDTSSPYSYNWNTTTATNGTHTLTATARDAAGNTTTSNSVSVTINNQTLTTPVISTFTASPNSIISGQNSTLSWSVTGATSLSINQSVGSVTPLTSGTKVVTPTMTTTYTLTATNSIGSTTASTTVTVGTTPPPVAGCDYYASSVVTSGGSGTSTSPWSLHTALAQTNTIISGKTLCLQGGTYRGKFLSNLSGATVRSAPGEWAIIDGYQYTTLPAAITATQMSFSVADASKLAPSIQSGGTADVVIDGETFHNVAFNGNTLTFDNRAAAGSSTGAVAHNAGSIVRLAYSTFNVLGNNSIYRDMEITNSDPLRNWDTDGQEGIRGAGVLVNGNANKFINLVIHENLNGVFSGSASSNNDLYGNIVYNNGVFIPSRNGGGGHGLYLENQSGTLRALDNIVFDNFGLGTQVYGRSACDPGVTIEGNIYANSASPVGGFERNLLVGPETCPINGILIQNNYFFHPINSIGTNMVLGYGAGVSNGQVLNNYFVGGRGVGMASEIADHATVTGNKFYMPGTSAVNVQSLQGVGHTWNNNTYYATGVNDDKFGNRSTSNNYIFADWKSMTGFDSTSTISGGAMPDTVVVRPNAYEAGRANVVAYNISRAGSINVNLSQAGLTNGQTFKIKNAINWNGGDVIFNGSTSGTYNSSNPTINIPLSGNACSVATPVGGTAIAQLCPDFASFVIMPTGISGGFAAPTTPPSQVITPPTSPTQPVTLTPGVSNFKYASNSTIYFLDVNGMKQAYTEAAVFLAWNSNYNNVVTIPETQTYLDAPTTVRLPEGKLVKVSSSSTIYITEGTTVRPFASLAALTSRGYSLSQVITISVDYLHTYSLGATIN